MKNRWNPFEIGIAGKFLASVVAMLCLLGGGPATKPATQPGDSQDIEVTGNGSMRIEINNGSVHVIPDGAGSTTQPSGGTNPRMRIHLRSNRAGAAATPPIEVKAMDVGIATDNPLAKLLPEGIALFKKRNVDIEAMQKMKAVVLDGQYTGAHRRDVVNDDASLVIVLSSKFATHGSIQSVGPIIVQSANGVMGKISGGSIVWFIGNATPRDEVSGSPIILSPGTFMAQGKFKSPEVWIGKYGWSDQ